MNKSIPVITGDSDTDELLEDERIAQEKVTKELKERVKEKANKFMNANYCDYELLEKHHGGINSIDPFAEVFDESSGNEVLIKKDISIDCVICKQPIPSDPDGWNGGHNPQPVRDKGRCCGECNDTIVLPKRLSDAGINADADLIAAALKQGRLFENSKSVKIFLAGGKEE